MRISVISDTHGREGWELTRKCDLFIHCGNITAGGTLEETKRFFATLRNNWSHIRTIVVPGNHDKCFEEQPEEMLELAHEYEIDLLIDEGLTIHGKTFWGSPWTPPFMNWNFMMDEDSLANLYRHLMPRELDVLITHGPPRSILDPGHLDPHVGSTALLQAIKSRNIGDHFFGHLRSAGGMRAVIGYDGNIVRHYNVAACDEAYNLVRNCLVVDI